MSDKNPYAAAANAYGSTAAATDPRALEGQVLLKAAAKLENLSERLKGGEKVPLEDISEVMTFNRKLWTIFASDAANPDHPLPKEIKNNIATLAVFIFKRTLEVLIETTPEKLQVLIEINRNIAAGLLKRAASVPEPAAQNSQAAGQPAAKAPRLPPASSRRNRATSRRKSLRAANRPTA